ncbi:MAG: hypothetical protein H7A23_08965 [Leptospiraceae bacterium]|nr:hypothetical protein [Leptospiraceae bacterium]MCP5494673.1 hypothetical protein [Leptospiraceae bacterium]
MFTRFKILLIILVVSFGSGIWAQEDIESFDNPDVPHTEPDYNLTYFGIKDFSKDIYEVSIAKKRGDTKTLIDELNQKAPKHLRLQIGEVRADIIKESAETDINNSNIVNFKIMAYEMISEKDKELRLFSVENGHEKLESTYIIKSLNLDRHRQPDAQPLIEKIEPKGGVMGGSVTVHGRNFGADIDQVYIEFIYKKDHEGKGHSDSKDIEIRPFYISTPDPQTKNQILKFTIPLSQTIDNLIGIFRVSLPMRVVVNGRPSDYIALSIIPHSYKLRAGSLSVFVVLLFLFLIGVIVKKYNYVNLILMDKTTQTYSLSKFQAFSWTIVLVGSYFYVAICHALFLRNGIIPDFNPSLLVLMGVSYGGLLGANALGKTKNERIDTEPELSNLICDGGMIDLSRLQLFCFTIISILIYLYTLYTTNVLDGLPDLPPTLLGLLGVSQGGYLGGKVMGGKISINQITPEKIVFGKTPRVVLVGSGFVAETKVIFEGYDTIKTEYLNPTSIAFIIPEFDEIGDKEMILAPPNGNTLVLPKAIQIIEQEQDERKTHSIVASTEEIQSEFADADEIDVEAEEKINKKPTKSSKKKS